MLGGVWLYSRVPPRGEGVEEPLGGPPDESPGARRTSNQAHLSFTDPAHRRRRSARRCWRRRWVRALSQSRWAQVSIVASYRSSRHAARVRNYGEEVTWRRRPLSTAAAGMPTTRSASSQSEKSRSRAIKPRSIQKTWPRRESSSMPLTRARSRILQKKAMTSPASTSSSGVWSRNSQASRRSADHREGPRGPDRRWASPR